MLLQALLGFWGCLVSYHCTFHFGVTPYLLFLVWCVELFFENLICYYCYCCWVDLGTCETILWTHSAARKSRLSHGWDTLRTTLHRKIYYTHTVTANIQPCNLCFKKMWSRKMWLFAFKLISLNQLFLKMYLYSISAPHLYGKSSLPAQNTK